MTIALSQLQQVAEGSGGSVASTKGAGGYTLTLLSATTLFGVLAELSQLGLESRHVYLRAPWYVLAELSQLGLQSQRVHPLAPWYVWITPAGVTV